MQKCDIDLLIEFYKLFDYKSNNRFTIRKWHKLTAVDYFLLNVPISQSDWNHMLSIVVSDFNIYGMEPEIYIFEENTEYIIFSNHSFKGYSYKKLHEWYQKWITTVTKEFKYFEVLKYEDPLLKEWTAYNHLNQLVKKKHKFYYVIKAKLAPSIERWEQFNEALLFNRYLRDTLYESNGNFSWKYY
ncbi:hypothetical protein [Spiroplasma sp. DGKH1]|uniref:hypothetical protein n=1 Tax=Spiroplasma sp. DGKH1 TaxID=3050074 RepID=UPI0034C62AA0